jgi:aminopeptidase YwaD
LFPAPGRSFDGTVLGVSASARSVLATLPTALVLALVVGCSADEGPEPIRPVEPTETTAGASPTPTPSDPAAPSATSSATPSGDPSGDPASDLASGPRASPDDVRVATATAAVRHLANTIGPRPGTSPEFFRAAAWVESRLTDLGWQVEQQQVPTPAGVSWGVRVPAGQSLNLIATRGDVRPGEPWLLVGAHLDTVPQSPGAEDNASGIGVLLATAGALVGRQTRLPVVLVAFGSEEPRGETDDDHHYGSRAYVAALDRAQRRALRGMVSLDRVGVGAVLPVGSPAEPNALTDELRQAADRAGVATTMDVFQRSSDHWSFARGGLPGARLGSTSYAAYHSARDVPSVVDPAQLERTARTVVSWLR